MRLKYYYLFFISVTAFVVWIFFSFSKENLADKEIIKECVSFYTLDYDLNFNDIASTFIYCTNKRLITKRC